MNKVYAECQHNKNEKPTTQEKAESYLNAVGRKRVQKDKYAESHRPPRELEAGEKSEYEMEETQEKLSTKKEDHEKAKAEPEQLLEKGSEGSEAPETTG